MFKVVADQLRISDGWVRCGQCKQVFDASAQLLPAQPEALMPDFALDQLRAPPQPVPRTDPQARSWGSLPTPAVAVEAAPVVVQPDAAPVPAAPHTPSVMAVPEQAVPAFLAAREPVAPASELADLPPLTLVPETSFAWRLPEPAVVPTPPTEPAAPLPASDIEWPAIDFAPPPAGYELPSPMLEDADPRDLLEPASGAPGVLVPPEPETGWAPEHEPVPESAPEPGPAPEDGSASDAEAPEAQDAEEDQDLVQPDTAEDGDEEVLAAEAPDASATESESLVQQDGVQADPEAEPLPSTDEPSFVRAARRQAFWRKPMVRSGLALLSLLLLAGLVLQVALQERHYLAAVVPQARAPLEALCGPLQCEVGPYRHIASVVVDGSSFQKLKGEDYQFSLTLRNRADHGVEMPAVELTLTDAQEQPVLRRVLRPEELAAPAELLAQAEWSVTVPVQMAPGVARITGYRVLAFYP